MKKKKKGIIQKILDIFFGLSILSLVLPWFIFENFSFYTTFWLTMIIPLISCLLGKKYKKEGYESDKNINAGAIIAMLLFMIGLLAFIVSKQVV